MNPHLGAACIQNNIIVCSRPLTLNLDSLGSAGDSHEVVLWTLLCRPKVEQSWLPVSLHHFLSSILLVLCWFCCFVSCFPVLSMSASEEHFALLCTMRWLVLSSDVADGRFPPISTRNNAIVTDPRYFVLGGRYPCGTGGELDGCLRAANAESWCAEHCLHDKPSGVANTRSSSVSASRSWMRVCHCRQQMTFHFHTGIRFTAFLGFLLWKKVRTNISIRL